MSQIFKHGYALLIGVGNSVYPEWSLPVTVKDMKAIHNVLTDVNLCSYPNDEQHIRLLHDKNATLNSILDGLSWLKEQIANAPEATAIVYYSGHGWIDKSTNEYYLIPSDVDPFNVSGSALSANLFTESLHNIGAKRLLVIVDSCHAKGMATTKDIPNLKLPPSFVQKALPKNVVNTLKQGEGYAVFTSSRENQISWIRPDDTMSIYTYHLIEAFHGANNKQKDNVIRISNLMNHLSINVPKSASELCNAEQTPFFDTATEDFPIAMLRGGKGLSIGGQDQVQNEFDETLQRITNITGDVQKTSGKNSSNH